MPRRVTQTETEENTYKTIVVPLFLLFFRFTWTLINGSKHWRLELFIYLLKAAKTKTLNLVFLCGLLKTAEVKFTRWFGFCPLPERFNVICFFSGVYSHTRTHCLAWPMRDWFGGHIFTDNSSRRQGWRRWRWRWRALWCAPWHPTCPKDSGEPRSLLGPNLDLSVSDK